MSGREILLSIAVGLLVNECCDVSPWFARKIVCWSARHRYAGDPLRIEIRTEELVALIDARPGKLFKLATSLGFAGGAITAMAPGAVNYQIRLVRRTPTPLAGTILGAGLIASWAVLFEYQVNVPEAYTLPLAVSALLLGMLVALRHRPGWSSWRCYGSALLTGFLPTLAMIWISPSLVRLVALSVAAVLTLVAGTVRRMKAPVVVGMLVLPIALVVLLTHLVPWTLLAVALMAGTGVALMALGATYERRRAAHRWHAAALFKSGQGTQVLRHQPSSTPMRGT